MNCEDEKYIRRAASNSEEAALVINGIREALSSNNPDDRKAAQIAIDAIRIIRNELKTLH